MSAEASRELAERLASEPYRFGFFQAVRLLELLADEDAEPVGADTDPDEETVRFTVHPSLSFPASEIQDIDTTSSPNSMEVNFLGLIGPQGVLPQEYTVQVMDRLKASTPDRAMQAFFDMFHHRAISLFYRAWEKHRYQLVWERGGPHGLVDHMLDLLGLGPEDVRASSSIPPRVLACYGGLLGPQPRSAAALEGLLTDYFDVPCAVEQFVGDWLKLESWDLCRLGEEDAPPVRLGMGAMAGDEAWDVHARARVTIGPLPPDRFEAFLPGGGDHQILKDLLRFFSDDRVGFEVQLLLDKEHVRGVVLDGSASQRLGWSTWIQTHERTHHGNETVFQI